MPNDAFRAYRELLHRRWQILRLGFRGKCLADPAHSNRRGAGTERKALFDLTPQLFIDGKPVPSLSQVVGRSKQLRTAVGAWCKQMVLDDSERRVALLPEPPSEVMAGVYSEYMNRPNYREWYLADLRS